MARNLVSAGLPAVWDQSPTTTSCLSMPDAGGSVVGGRSGCYVVITMLPTAKVVNSVIFAGGVVGAG
jgi:3-hydroxyisobutyrate dehydrogenase-like beta-hydroxyacid dehydrogenase